MLHRFNSFVDDNKLFNYMRLSQDSTDDEIESSGDTDEWIKISKELINTDDESDGEIVVIDPVFKDMKTEVFDTFNCKLCNKNFAYKKNLKAHLKTVHKAEGSVSEEKPRKVPASYAKVACEICDKIIVKGNLARHKRDVHQEFSELKVIKVKVEKNSNRMYRCDFPSCLMVYKNRSSLNSHKKMHKGKKTTFLTKKCSIK
jgi:hypothetical protein